MFHIFLGNSCSTPETFDLSGYDIVEHSPCYNRLILKIVPILCHDNNNNNGSRSRFFSTSQQNVLQKTTTKNTDYLCHNNNISNSGSYCDGASFGSNAGFYNSSCSINSSGADKVLFMGFEESWERDLWSTWLIEVNNFFFFPNIANSVP